MHEARSRIVKRTKMKGPPEREGPGPWRGSLRMRAQKDGLRVLTDTERFELLAWGNMLAPVA